MAVTKQKFPPNLLLRGQTWFVRVPVPRPLQTAVGKRQVVLTLRTHSKAEAMERRHAAIAEIKAGFRKPGEAAPALPGAAAAQLPAARLRSALDWRKASAELSAGKVEGLDLDHGRPPGVDPVEWARAIISSEIEETAEDIEATHGPAAALAYTGIAHGTATPVLLHLNAWLTEGGRKGPLSVKTAAGYRADMRALETWLAGAGVTTVEGVTKAVAGRWVSETMVAARVPWATANKRISAPASYWRWMLKRGHASGESPWSGQSLAKARAHRGEAGTKRPFSTAEVKALLAGPADTEMADAMRIAALSGLRIEELYQLRVADCADGWFRVRQGKSAAAVRRVPVHSALAAIVARRTDNRAPDGFLMKEGTTSRSGRGRSVPMSKRFGRYRQGCKVHEVAEGRRGSAVDFHSWRRWFTTEAERAGIAPHVIDYVTGHDRPGETLGRYSAGPSDEQLRACVGAVALP